MMLQCIQKFGLTIISAIFINIVVLVVTITSIALLAGEVPGLRLLHYSSFPVFLHVLCLCLILIVISILTFMIFFKNNFSNWFSTLGFFFYTVLEVVLFINVLTMENVKKVNYYIECGFILVLLFLYFQCVSLHYQHWEDIQKQRHENYVNSIISTIGRGQGDCIRIPLSGGGNISLKTSNINPKPGPSSRL